MLRYRFDPFCASSSIKIFAEVEEKGRGTKLNNTASVPLVANQVRFSFDEAMPRMFRPGMEYSVRVSDFVCMCGCACLMNPQAHAQHFSLASGFFPFVQFCTYMWWHRSSHCYQVTYQHASRDFTSLLLPIMETWASGLTIKHSGLTRGESGWRASWSQVEPTVWR